MLIPRWCFTFCGALTPWLPLLFQARCPCQQEKWCTVADWYHLMVGCYSSRVSEGHRRSKRAIMANLNKNRSVLVSLARASCFFVSLLTHRLNAVSLGEVPEPFSRDSRTSGNFIYSCCSTGRWASRQAYIHLEVGFRAHIVRNSLPNVS